MRPCCLEKRLVYELCSMDIVGAIIDRPLDSPYEFAEIYRDKLQYFSARALSERPYIRKTQTVAERKGRGICRALGCYSFKIRFAVLLAICSNCALVRFSSLNRFTSVTGSQRG